MSEFEQKCDSRLPLVPALFGTRLAARGKARKGAVPLLSNVHGGIIARLFVEGNSKLVQWLSHCQAPWEGAMMTRRTSLACPIGRKLAANSSGLNTWSTTGEYQRRRSCSERLVVGALGEHSARYIHVSCVFRQCG